MSAKWLTCKTRMVRVEWANLHNGDTIYYQLRSEGCKQSGEALGPFTVIDKNERTIKNTNGVTLCTRNFDVDFYVIEGQYKLEDNRHITIRLLGSTCTGKTTIANWLAGELRSRGATVELLDNDTVIDNEPRMERVVPGLTVRVETMDTTRESMESKK